MILLLPTAHAAALHLAHRLRTRPVTSSAAPARRAIFSGLASDELAAVSDHLNSLGVEFDFERADANSRRALALEVYDDSEQWLLDDVSAAIDCLEFEQPMIVAALDGDAPTLDAAVRAHMDAYALDTPVATRPTSWEPERASPVLNVELDGAEVDGRFDVSSVVAVDGIVDDALREALLELLGGGEEPHPEFWEQGVFTDTTTGDAGRGGYGLRAEALEALCADEPPPAAIVELQSRLAKLIAAANAESVVVARQPEAALGGEVPPLAGNAPCAADAADAYSWHVDADPLQLPPSPWTDAFGRYPNRAPGKPRFVSALVYLNPAWEAEWGAPTRFLDCGSGDVLEVPVAPGRVVLLDMDVSHSVTAPTAAAGERARYSLVFKLVLHPSGGEAAIADPRWGAPVRFGSAVLPS